MRQIDSEKDLKDLKIINMEYFDWACKKLKTEHNIEFIPIDDNYQKALEDYAICTSEDYGFYQPPNGIFYLIYVNNKVIGMGGIKRIEEEIGEIKRMYIQPEHRGNKLGKKLFKQLIKDAKRFGFSRLRLDSAGFMDTAHHIYRSYGFKEIEPYPQSEVQDEFKVHWVFMEARIDF